MTTIDELVLMKHESMTPFPNKYIWLMMSIEDDLISKSNPESRITQRLDQYNFDNKAKIMILHQFAKSKPQLSVELSEIFKMDNLTVKEMKLDKKYVDELINNF